MNERLKVDLYRSVGIAESNEFSTIGLQPEEVRDLLKEADKADRRLALLKDIAAWYRDTANAHYRYLPLDLLDRLEKELADEDSEGGIQNDT